MMLKLSDQTEVSLEDLCQQAKYTVLYFYPKDLTSGCTMQAELFRDHIAVFNENEVQVVGVSRDSMKRHDKFISQHNLPFRLIADESSELCNQFDVLKEKSMYGKTYIGIERSTFILGQEAQIIQEWRKVKIEDHVMDLVQRLPEYING